MSLSELLPALRQLDQAEKRYVLQFLLRELAKNAPADSQECVVWSPHSAFEAANVLMEALFEDPDLDQCP